MKKLTDSALGALKQEWTDRVNRAISNQIARVAYKSDIEEIVFSESDIAKDFADEIKENFNTDDFEEWDLIEWIRDIQYAEIENAAPVAVSLEQYIADKFDNSQVAFAKKQGVLKQQVTKWLDADFIVIDDQLFSKRRDLET